MAEAQARLMAIPGSLPMLDRILDEWEYESCRLQIEAMATWDRAVELVAEGKPVEIVWLEDESLSRLP